MMTPVLASAFTWFEHFLPFVHEGNIHIATALFLLAIFTLLGVMYKKSLGNIEAELVPTEGVNFKNFVQVIIEGIYGIVAGVIPHHTEKYFPVLGSVFVYVLFGNLIGLVPGFLPPTESMNTNLAVAIAIFIYFNYCGIKAQGFGHYLAHFAGPMPALAILIFPIEIVGLFIRPVSLSMRLFGNINGDHILVSTIYDMFAPLLPIPFMTFGILVCLIQAFVFTLLSSVYVGMAIEEEH